MSIETNYDSEAGIRIHLVNGAITFEDIIAELSSIYDADDLPTRANVVWDLTGADVSGISTEEVAQLARFVNAAWQEQSGFRAAFVVQPGLTYGMTRMYEQLLGLFEDDNIRIFPVQAEALAWITDQDG